MKDRVRSDRDDRNLRFSHRVVSAVCRRRVGANGLKLVGGLNVGHLSDCSYLRARYTGPIF